IVYAGAIMVLFLFVIMLLNVPREEPATVGLGGVLGPVAMRAAVLLPVLLGVEVIWALSRVGISGFAEGRAAGPVSSVAAIGTALFTRHSFAFEATSVLIIVAMVGAVVLARKEH